MWRTDAGARIRVAGPSSSDRGRRPQRVSGPWRPVGAGPRPVVSESGCLGMQPEAGGRLHLRLNTVARPTANKYREGKLKSTLKRELKSTRNRQEANARALRGPRRASAGRRGDPPGRCTARADVPRPARRRPKATSKAAGPPGSAVSASTGPAAGPRRIAAPAPASAGVDRRDGGSRRPSGRCPQRSVRAVESSSPRRLATGARGRRHREVALATRLETRTEESNARASRGESRNPQAQRR